MRNLSIATILVALTGTAATAQAPAMSHNPALKNGAPHATSSAAPGRNSFTVNQAKGRLEKAGYTGVSKLTKDKDGVWIGTAMKGGVKANVGVDYKGDVVVR